METLTPEQINNWRRIIAMRLESLSPGAGLYAMIMPESEVIDYWRNVKAIIESKPLPSNITKSKNLVRSTKSQCKHENSITGNCGTYCIDCEKYI